jgi:hypothetical protein
MLKMTDLLKKRAFIFEYIKYISIFTSSNNTGIAHHPQRGQNFENLQL